MNLAHKFVAAAVFASALGSTSVFAAVPTQLRAYAGVVGGAAYGGIGPAGCSIAGPVLGGGWRGGLYLPTEGFAGCNLLGGLDDRTAALGPLTAGQTLTASPLPNGSYTGTAQARAEYWSLGVANNGTMTGNTSGTTYHQSAAFANFSDTITLSSPGIATGTAGLINFSFRIAGAITNNPRFPYAQQVDAHLQTRVNSRFAWDVFYATVNGSDLPYLRGGATGLPGMFILGPGSLSGSANVTSTADFDFLWGVPFSVEVSLATEGSPCCLGTSFSSNFLNSAVLSGIDAYSPTGQVTQFTVITDSGALIGAGGLVPVPEPASALTLLAGLAAFAAWRYRCGSGSRA